MFFIVKNILKLQKGGRNPAEIEEVVSEDSGKLVAASEFSQLRKDIAPSEEQHRDFAEIVNKVINTQQPEIIRAYSEFQAAGK